MYNRQGLSVRQIKYSLSISVLLSASTDTHSWYSSSNTRVPTLLQVEEQPEGEEMGPHGPRGAAPVQDGHNRRREQEAST